MRRASLQGFKYPVHDLFCPQFPIGTVATHLIEMAQVGGQGGRRERAKLTIFGVTGEG